VQLVPPERLTLLERYGGLLASDGITRGLIGPREVPRLWDRHLLNCALLAPLIGDGASVADLGSGAGLPGLVLAIARPDLRITLVEPMARRVEFLEEVCAELGLESARVVRTRAEQWDEAMGFDVVTARALAPLARLLAWGMPLVGPSGCLLAMKGSSAAEEVAASRPELTRLRARAELVTSSVPGCQPITVVRVVRETGSGIGLRSESARRRRRERA
jgi:16S rRNA (guanine527-N7)-methyltransferase